MTGMEKLRKRAGDLADFDCDGMNFTIVNDPVWCGGRGEIHAWEFLVTDSRGRQFNVIADPRYATMKSIARKAKTAGRMRF